MFHRSTDFLPATAPELLLQSTDAAQLETLATYFEDQARRLRAAAYDVRRQAINKRESVTHFAIAEIEFLKMGARCAALRTLRGSTESAVDLLRARTGERRESIYFAWRAWQLHKVKMLGKKRYDRKRSLEKK